MEDIYNPSEIDTEKLKKGSLRCRLCGQKMSAYPNTLSKMMVNLLLDIRDETIKRKSSHYRPRNIWEGYTQLNNHQKLRYFGLITETKISGLWRITLLGVRFLKGKIQVPKKVWISKGQIIDAEGLIWIWQAEPQWQRRPADYAGEQIPQKYESVSKLKTKKFIVKGQSKLL